MLWVLIRSASVKTQLMFSSRNKENVNFRASKFWLDKVDSDHLLVRGQVIKFYNSTTLPKVSNSKKYIYYIMFKTLGKLLQGQLLKIKYDQVFKLNHILFLYLA